MNLKPGTLIVLVYDTDVQNDEMLINNINKINDFISVMSVEEFKSKFLSMKESAIDSKLKMHDFSMKRMWSRQGSGCFEKYKTKDGIKLIKKV